MAKKNKEEGSIGDLFDGLAELFAAASITCEIASQTYDKIVKEDD